MDKKGSALIISMLLLAVISTASFAMARLALIELKSSSVQAANVKAYYLAEGGLEEGLLRWRYDHNAELASGSTESAKKWQRTDISSSPMSSTTKTTATFNPPGISVLTDFIGLTIYSKVQQSQYGATNSKNLWTQFSDPSDGSTFLNNYVSTRPDLYVKKDNKITFTVPKKVGPSDADDILLMWRWDKIAGSTTSGFSDTANKNWFQRNTDDKFGVEIRIYKAGSSVLLDKMVFSPSSLYNIPNSNNYGSNAGSICDHGSHACRINVKAAFHAYAFDQKTIITITPINANIVVGAYGLTSNDVGADYYDSIVHLQGIGMASGRTRGLETAIDRNSGQILGLYDFVVFQGN